MPLVANTLTVAHCLGRAGIAGAVCLALGAGCLRPAKPDAGGTAATTAPITPPEEAVVVKQNRLLGGLVSGGALGAGGGYVIGARADKNDAAHRDEAIAASKGADRMPASRED